MNTPPEDQSEKERILVNEAPSTDVNAVHPPKQKETSLGSAIYAWRRKELWSRKTATFCVEVSRHDEEPLSAISPELGPHRWCVYAYLYPAHPRFQKFDGTNSFFQSACSELPLHGVITGASYLQYHYAGGGQTVCIQVGADYNHLRDERFSHTEPENSGEVFDDAERLFSYLQSEAESVGRALNPG